MQAGAPGATREAAIGAVVSGSGFLTAPKPGLLFLLVHRWGAVLAALLLVALWSLMAAFQPAYLFPSLPVVIAEIVDLGAKGTLANSTLTTVRSVLLGSAGALLLGTLYGFFLLRLEGLSKPFLYLLQTVPSVLWALLAIIWFGLSPGSVVFVVVVVGIPIVATNVWEGLRNVDRQLLEMAESVDARRAMVVRHIVLPSLQPYLMSATRTMIGFGWRYAVLGELFAGGGGVGYRLFFAWERNDVPEVFAWALWLVLLMLITEYTILRPIDRRVTSWRTP